MRCHEGIESIASGEMDEQIRRLGERYSDPAGCVVCHGGVPEANAPEAAHQGAPKLLSEAGGPRRFSPNPGDTRVADRTCGQCHNGYAERWRKSIMSTEAETIERKLCAPAWENREKNEQEHRLFGRYRVEDDDGPEPATGSPAYRKLMRSSAVYPAKRFPMRLHAVPPSIALQAGENMPASCLNCHRRSKPVSHGNGCSFCHIPYRRGGTYQGLDPTVDRRQVGKLLFHRIQGSGTTRVGMPGVSGRTWFGIPADNCFLCHFDTRRVAVSRIGPAHVHYAGGQAESSGGLLCQDCHTSIEMHGDGNIAVHSSDQMEVRCEDCHGTTDRFPWELPLGYESPEHVPVLSNSARGTTIVLLETQKKRYPAIDGHLLTSRGNPFENATKNDEHVFLYSASGRTIEVPLLKRLAQKGSWRTELGRQVKAQTKGHRHMECTECHADWAPPCYGCHAESTGPSDRN